MFKVVTLVMLNLCLLVVCAFHGGTMRVNVPHFNEITTFPDECTINTPGKLSANQSMLWLL
jgi:hypothetical protein